MQLRKRATAVAVTTALVLTSTAAVAAGSDEQIPDEADVAERDEGGDVADDETDGPEFEAEVDRPIVMLGDEVSVEAKYKVKVDDADVDETDADDETDEVDETDDAGASDEQPEELPGDGTGDVAAASTSEDGSTTTTALPTSVVFTVDYGDGTVTDLSIDELEADEEEFEAETEGDGYVYAAEGTYSVTVTATPDVGEALTTTLDITVTTDPVAYGRDIDDACPEADDDTQQDPEASPAPADGDVVAASFRDVRGSAHERAIACLAGLGVVAGRTATDFDPRAAVTREQAATLLARFLAEAGVTLPAADDAFGDDEGSVHEAAINELVALGLIGGVSADAFAPKASLSRGQMASLLVRLTELVAGAGLTSELDYFLDDDGSVHEDAVNRAAAAGIAAGRAQGEFAGSGTVTREQLATFLARVLDLLVEEGHVIA